MPENTARRIMRLLLDAGCSLAVENTMITHNPEVKEKLEELGIPVMIERSSYESHPLGRLEWIRFFGALLGKEEAADAYYEEQLSRIEPISAERKYREKGGVLRGVVRWQHYGAEAQ